MGRSFDIEKETKKSIAGYYFRDYKDWIFMYRAIISSPSNIDYNSLSLRTKKGILLRYGLECILKSLIFLVINDKNAHDSYKLIRKCGHKLEKLYNEFIERYKGNEELLKQDSVNRMIQLDKIKIDVRYDLEYKKGYKNEPHADYFLQTGDYSGTISNDNFQKVLFGDIQELLKIYNSIENKNSILNGNEHMIIENNVNNILN